MKRFFAILAIATATLLGLQSCEKDDNYINESLLPTEAQNFLTAHYSAVEIDSVIKDFDDFTYTYKVYLADGTRIEFKKNGGWKEVKNETVGVAHSVIPQKILEYVTTNYPNNFIVHIERGRDIDIELNDGLDLDFTHDGDFIRVDH